MHVNSYLLSSEYEESIKMRIKDLLVDIYGRQDAEHYYSWLLDGISEYRSGGQPGTEEYSGQFDPDAPFKTLAGKVFVIAYPDNIRTPGQTTLKTLSAVLKKYFPAVNGLHILPERVMCHYDVLEQDFYHFMDTAHSAECIKLLKKAGVLDENNIVTSRFEEKRAVLKKKYREEVIDILAKAWDYHFNDGGFSQIRRDRVDPRFGSLKDLRNISGEFALMLDYVVNHLDIDNPELEAFRQGRGLKDGDGGSFIILSGSEYAELRQSGQLEKTFRPRPFPLFTALRKYPGGRRKSLAGCAREMREMIVKSGHPAPDLCEIMYVSLFFKMANDQGLTAEDRRAVDGFTADCAKADELSRKWMADSDVHERQKKYLPGADLSAVCRTLGWDNAAAELFAENEDSIFGEKFYIYTTFSESQCDIYPKTRAGFKTVITDLFHILSGGDLAMLRMDAIKYLWKEIGEVNFDMDEGNKLAEVIKLTMRLAAPGVLPLDEVNSPDRTVYRMGSRGGFYYLFGPVNAVSVAFNEEDMTPLRNMQSLMKRFCSPDLLLFVMLSTHDGRSVQGLGLENSDGHVSFGQFYRLKDIVSANGGMAKYRSVAKGQVNEELIDKVLAEAALLKYEKELKALFERAGDGMYRLPRKLAGKDSFLKKFSALCGRSQKALEKMPALDFLFRRLFEGRTEYELCSTSRSSFDRRSEFVSSPELEARRLALAQLYIMTMGQHVPAIYFNDLFGQLNDSDGYRLSGKPRDLNRKKLVLDESGLITGSDDFLKHYLPLLDSMISIRTSDPAFFPGSPKFEELAVSNKVFVHHAFHDRHDSVIIGNISSASQDLDFSKNFSALIPPEDADDFSDALTGKPLTSVLADDGKLTMTPYYAYYLQKRGGL